MKNIVDYAQIPENQKQAQALKDIVCYIGNKDRYNKIHAELKSAIKDGLNLRGMEFQCGMFLGIEGYPVQAWYDAIKSELKAEGN